MRRTLCLIAASLLAHPLVAHHGAADFEMARVVTIKGTVVDYELINPHTEIVVKAAAEGSDPVDWHVESVSMNMMLRVGWKRDSLKTGDAVSVTGHPGKNGKPAMLLTKILLPDGRELAAPYQ